MTLQTVPLVDGTVLHTLDLPANGKPDQAGPALLFVHGFPFSHAMWQAQLSAPELAGYRRIAPDLRGFGANAPLSTESSATLTMSQLAQDLDQLLSALNVTQPVILCGLSMGGYVAWQFWRHHQERLAGLILCDTRAAADKPAVAKARHYLADRVLRDGPREASHEMLQKVFTQQHVSDSPEFVTQMLEIMVETDKHTVAGALRGMAERPDMTARLPQVRCPALLLCGAEDQITPPAEMQGIAQQMPNATFHEIDSAAHMAPLENPQVVNRLIADFVPRVRI